MLKHFILIAATSLALASCTGNADTAQLPANAQTASFKVWGNCGMCEKTIEKGAKAGGALTASWDKGDDQIQVAFDPAKTNLQTIHSAIAAAGYDTDQAKGDDGAYAKLPECCRYERRTE